MWQAPNQRLRAQANAKKRERDRYKIPFHIKRVVASVQLQTVGGEPQKFEARALLNDFSPRGMGLFSAHLFSQGDEITVTIETPEKIEVKGKIAWCQEYFVVGKVLKAKSFSYRAGVQFTFASAEEEEAVRKFCETLLNTHHCVSLRHDGKPDGREARDKNPVKTGDKAPGDKVEDAASATAAPVAAPGEAVPADPAAVAAASEPGLPSPPTKDEAKAGEGQAAA